MAATQNTTIPGTGWGSPYLDSLIWGAAGWTGGPITYAFVSGDFPGSWTGEGATWTQRDKDALVAATQLYADVCGLTFAEADAASANLLWGQEDMSDTGTFGWHDIPDGTKAQLTGDFNSASEGWQWLATGSRAFRTIIHELGHAVGLAHPHDGGAQPDKTLFPGLEPFGDYWHDMGLDNQNQGVFTVMSYLWGWDATYGTQVSEEYGCAGSLMALDVAALQALYGANTGTRTGDDVYTCRTPMCWAPAGSASGMPAATTPSATPAATSPAASTCARRN